MTDLFTSYEQQYITTLTTINRKIQSINVQTNQKKQLAFVDIREDQKQCQKLVKLMETQSNGFDVQFKFQYTKKVRQYKKELDDSKKKLNKVEEQYALAKNKEMLMGAQIDQQKTSTNRQKLIKQGQMLSDTNYKLKDSVRVIRQTQQIGNAIQIQLTTHTQKMKTNKQRLIEMQDDISSSGQKIKSIMMRIRKNKFILAGSMLIVLVIIIIAVIVHFARK